MVFENPFFSGWFNHLLLLLIRADFIIKIMDVPCKKKFLCRVDYMCPEVMCVLMRIFLDGSQMYVNKNYNYYYYSYKYNYDLYMNIYIINFIAVGNRILGYCINRKKNDSICYS